MNSSAMTVRWLAWAAHSVSNMMQSNFLIIPPWLYQCNLSVYDVKSIEPISPILDIVMGQYYNAIHDSAARYGPCLPANRMVLSCMMKGGHG